MWIELFFRPSTPEPLNCRIHPSAEKRWINPKQLVLNISLLVSMTSEQSSMRWKEPNSLWYQIKTNISFLLQMVQIKCASLLNEGGFFFLNSNSTDHLCNILWGLCQSGRSRWKVDTHSFCRLSHCPDSWQQRFFFPSSFFWGGVSWLPISVSAYARSGRMMLPLLHQRDTL